MKAKYTQTGQALHAILETMLCFLNPGTKIAQNKTLLKKKETDLWPAWICVQRRTFEKLEESPLFCSRPLATGKGSHGISKRSTGVTSILERPTLPQDISELHATTRMRFFNNIIRSQKVTSRT